MSHVKLQSTLSLAKKAGKLILGFDVVKTAVTKKQLSEIFVSTELSEKSLKEVRFIADKEHLAIYSLPFSMDELWFIVGKRCGIIGINDKGFAKLMKALL